MTKLDIVLEYVCREEANGKRWVCRNDIYKNLNMDNIERPVAELVKAGILLKEYFNGNTVRYKLAS